METNKLQLYQRWKFKEKSRRIGKGIRENGKKHRFNPNRAGFLDVA